MFVIGTMMFGLRASYAHIRSIVSRASDLGVLEYDTSPSYIAGEAQRLLSFALRESCIGNAVIHSKVGCSYGANMPKNRYYLSRYHIRKALDTIFDCFASFDIGNIQVHIHQDYDQLLDAIAFLAEYISAKNRFSGIGLCNLDNNTAKKVLLDFGSLHPAIMLTLQRRLAIGLESEVIPTGLSGWAYGMLNAGASVPAEKLNSLSRFHSAKDSIHIKERQNLIESSETYLRARDLCLRSNVHFVDFAIAYPLLSGYSKVIIGPTKYCHLDAVERLLNESYLSRVVDLYNDIYAYMPER